MDVSWCASRAELQSSALHCTSNAAKAAEPEGQRGGGAASQAVCVAIAIPSVVGLWCESGGQEDASCCWRCIMSCASFGSGWGAGGHSSSARGGRGLTPTCRFFSTAQLQHRPGRRLPHLSPRQSPSETRQRLARDSPEPARASQRP
jgi:hypothetical protein